MTQGAIIRRVLRGLKTMFRGEARGGAEYAGRTLGRQAFRPSILLSKQLAGWPWAWPPKPINEPG